ncbi:hypothetical protein DI09_79p70 [Mitosporidium daphniae]|uniref:Uncharacterized protein n=1 Tax=Mitosporidium daphniae TaxID=1485682 RepID=A0A098VNB7_9MICR|nr:uncharacterized protein DI09_79p70 [Mitosporidium daphniae]KGG50284.1 hypothetical protein DI09_79p70 [Mitosporidium daphniae]|eukprot:XP_013236728.1 uncharacterized protein DI09_79p70 [Mitosporidium daphniae]
MYLWKPVNSSIRSSFDFTEADKDLPEVFDPNEIVSQSPTFKDRLPDLPVGPLQISSIFTDLSDFISDRHTAAPGQKKRKSLSPTSKRKLLFDPETELTADYLSSLIKDSEALICPHKISTVNHIL